MGAGGHERLIRYGGGFASDLVVRASGSWLETADGRRVLDFTAGQICATVVNVINSVVGGSAIAIAIGAIADAPLGVAAGVGGVAALVSLVALVRYADRLLEERAGGTESIFPSPQ